MSEETRRQVIEMSAGILVHNLVLFLVSVIWFRKVSVFLGILLGMILAVGLLVSMAMSTELCVEAADENYARRKMTIHAALRSIGLFAVIALCWKFLDISLVALVLGILGLKTGAYLYPAVHKLMDHKTKNDEV